ncbi:disease resistance-like protein DSC2 [Pyrus x bretschneideri]|uniref:disease resistance-like protein DSC2 n=1 Tax=Pyrus x bretschneideri TaxID=225117 RepID=UPI00202DBBCB|nr:disease resistance-like protein DSC2 [Pyrus x bretschneideri]
MRKAQEWRRALEKVSVIDGMKSDDYWHMWESWDRFLQHTVSSNQLLSSVLKSKTQVVDDYAGSVMTKKCFYNKKVLAFGVDQLGQLARVAGNKNWFGLGSRIIVTTRDERQLEEHDHELYDEFAEGLLGGSNFDSHPPCVDGFRICAGCTGILGMGGI